jgi:PGF-CTERM protein
VSGASLDAGANTVSANITSFSEVAVYGNESAEGGGDGGDGGDGDDGGDAGDGRDGDDAEETDDAPDITDYAVTADGDEITVSFDSDENLVDIEVAVSGPEDATLTEDDFTGDRFSGYEATYRAGEDGDYTLELVTAEDASNNDGADEETFSESVTVDTDDGTATPTEEPVDETETQTNEPGGETPTSTRESTAATEVDTDTTTAAPATPADGTETHTSSDGPGFGLVVALVALLAAAALLVRRG